MVKLSPKLRNYLKLKTTNKITDILPGEVTYLLCLNLLDCFYLLALLVKRVFPFFLLPRDSNIGDIQMWVLLAVSSVSQQCHSQGHSISK